MLRKPAISSIKRNAGFTMLELLVVMTIMALVLGVVAFWPTGGLDRAKLDMVARQVSQELNRARIAAIRENREAVFAVDVETGQYSAAGQLNALPTGVSMQVLTAKRETSADESSGRIRFYPDGTSTGGSVELRRSGHTRLVRIDWLTGHVQVSNGDADE